MSSPLTVKICTGRSCSERFSSFIEKRLLSDKDFYAYPEDVIIETCLCQGRCKEGPTVIFDSDIGLYMNPIKASETLRRKVGEWKNKRTPSKHEEK